MSVLIDSYSEGVTSTLMFGGASQPMAIGQSFTNTSLLKLSSSKFYTRQRGTPSGNVTARLYAHTGTFGTSSKGTGSALAISDSIAATGITNYGLTEFTFSGANKYELQPSTYYVIVFYYDGISGADYDNCVLVGADQSSPTHEGNKCWLSESTENWVSSDFDTQFYVYGEEIPPTVGTKYPLPAFKV